MTRAGFDSKLGHQTRMSAFFITLAASFHYFGYEFVRAASTTLFTGHFHTSWLPVALCVVPVAVLGALTIYRALIERYGPHVTVVATTLGCAALLLVLFLALGAGGHRGLVIFALFVFRQTYITFIVSQHWSRLTSCLKLQDAASMFGPIMGATSLFSVLGGVCVEPVVYELGEAGLVMVGVVSLVVSAVFAHLAYTAYVSADDLGHSGRARSLSGAGGHAVARSSDKGAASPSSGNKDGPSTTGNDSGFAGLVGLSSLSASPILPPMFMCTVAMQALATFVTLGFNSYLTEVYPIAEARATFTGKFFAAINFVAGLFQFCGVRLAFRALRLSTVLLVMPLGVVLSAMMLLSAPGLPFAALLLFVFKVTEYSLFAAAKELMYLPLDFEARYMAKEVVDVFGYRLGKGGTSLFLALLLPVVRLEAMAYAVLAAAGSLVWLWSTLRLRTTYQAHSPVEKTGL